MNLMKRLWKDESGATATEYAIIVAVLGVTVIAILITFRGQISNFFTNFSQEVSTNTDNPGDG
ncbi:MAG: Flp family type IVb pilin [Myxococcota bacterium]|nr:Flp family type IVb pilin [Myxococcota bacterium]